MGSFPIAIKVVNQSPGNDLTGASGKSLNKPLNQKKSKGTGQYATDATEDIDDQPYSEWKFSAPDIRQWPDKQLPESHSKKKESNGSFNPYKWYLKIERHDFKCREIDVDRDGSYCG